jgi:putative sporulation protein YtxC
MNVITVSMQGYDTLAAEKLVAHLRTSVDRLHREFYCGKAVCEISTDGPFILCDALLPQFQTNRDIPILLNALGQAFAHFVISDLEKPLLDKMIRQEYRCREDSEAAKIREYCDLILQGYADGEEERVLHAANADRQSKMAEKFVKYMEENTFFHMKGFITFRLQYYTEDLREVVRCGIDEYLLDQQYQEFITLLKYFVFAQEAKVPSAHLVHLQNNDFIILDDHLQPVESKKTNGLVLETVERDLNYEDLVVSTLINLSPEIVYIHCRETQLQVIQTIKHIFAERAVLCTDCRICRSKWENLPEHYNKL